jgi:hypothetical protein
MAVVEVLTGINRLSLGQINLNRKLKTKMEDSINQAKLKQISIHIPK